MSRDALRRTDLRPARGHARFSAGGKGRYAGGRRDPVR